MKYEIYEIEDIITKVTSEHNINTSKFIKDLKKFINSECDLVDIRLNKHIGFDSMIINALEIDVPHDCQYVWIIVRQ